jgi:hypothetical protein
MKTKKITIALLFLFLASFLINEKASAFWIFGSKKSTPIKTTTNTTPSLNEAEKKGAAFKYQLWEKSFEKRNIEEVIVNQNSFNLSVVEINHLFETEVKKIKNPSLTNVSITLSEQNINVATNFHKFVSGRFTFTARVVSVDNKVRLQLSGVKLYGVSIPAKWLEPKINKELDRYFAFMYQDKRYQGFDFINNGTNLQFKPKFSN